MSVGLLDFFVLEASDYVDRLQRLAATDEPQGPDSATLLKLARGLRGSAVMARLASFADASSGLERGARLLHEGRIAWTPGLAAAMTESIAELRSLIPMARLWGESHDQRARTAAGRLGAVLDDVERQGALMQGGGPAALAAASAPTAPASHAAPVPAPATPAPPAARPKNPAVTAFFDSLDQAVATPASVPVVPAAAEPIAATSAPARPVEPLPSATPTRGMPAHPDANMPIVPIAALAPADDADHVVFRAPNPAITFAQRFIADVSPLVGSLRARLAPLRQGAIQEASADMVAAFRPVLVSLRDIASSYQHDDIRSFCDAVLSAQAPLPAPSAGALDSALSVITQQDLAPHLRAQRLNELRRVVLAATPLTSASQSERTSRPTPYTQRPRTPTMSATVLPTPTVARPTPAAPSGRELSTLLSNSLEKVRELDATPLDLITVTEGGAPPARPAPDGEPDVVPIDALLYRGPRALSRARHIVGQLRTAGAPHDEELVNELLDLVELAGSAS
ncbi:MAG: hypothetical protein IT355_18325 [Gemmatimonadaceae bacterium]|nr:hypothetical protein [Gemmatimonadaceae bacterium]